MAETVANDLDSFTKAAMTGEHLSKADKALRDRFVLEYLCDYNPVAAAMRLGFLKDFAIEYSNRFMCEPYVQQKIKEYELGGSDQDDKVEHDKRRIMAIMWREAQNHGPGSSHSARVSAAATIAKLLGLEPPTKTESKVTLDSPVQFYLPDNGRDPVVKE